MRCRPSRPARQPNFPRAVRAKRCFGRRPLAQAAMAQRSCHPGARLRLIDLEGDGCVSMLVFNAENPVERLNVADTIKVQWNGYLQRGPIAALGYGARTHEYRGRRRRPTTFFAARQTRPRTHAATATARNWGRSPARAIGCCSGAAKVGLARKDVHPCINWFKGSAYRRRWRHATAGGPVPPVAQPRAAGGNEGDRRARQLSSSSWTRARPTR